MAIAFQTLQVVSRYRVRLTFSNVLAVGAFATGFYAIESVDSRGESPAVTEAMVVPNYPTAVELTLSVPLVEGALYQLVLGAGVPAFDASTAASAVQPFPVPLPRSSSGAVTIEAADAFVYGRDLVWEKGDFRLATNGDLASVTGPQNAMGAVTRRLMADGLPWDAEYGAHARKLVDAPSGSRHELRHLLAAEAIVDDRVSKARVDEIEDSETGDFAPDVVVTLLDDVPRPLSPRI